MTSSGETESEDSSVAFRKAVLRECGASDDVLGELLAYTENPYGAGRSRGPQTFPLPDEDHIPTWVGYADDARRDGAFAALKARFVQLRFPIRAGISQEDPYRRATRRGDFSAAEAFAPGLELRQPSELELIICPTIAGRIPVLVVADRDDFASLVRAFGARNEPVPVPASMGACIVSGLNNWDRISSYRRAWERSQQGPPSEAAWEAEFRRIIPRKQLYQDRFIILSRGPYSAVSADAVAMDPGEWLDHSLAIRREHEFTHYFTLRVFGAMRNNLHDELLADLAGLVRAFGRYRADLALRFLGLESYPRYRQGGRLEAYRGNPPLSEEGFRVLQHLAYRGVNNLARLSRDHGDMMRDLSGLARVIHALARLGLEAIASDDLQERVADSLR